MKQGKLITWLSAALLGISAAAAFSASMTAQAATGVCVIDKIEYTYDTGTNEASVTGYKGPAATPAVIPATIYVEELNKEFTVTEIGEIAFWNAGINRITLPDTLKTIGESAFFYAYRLQSVTIPSSVTKLGSYAFFNCKVLKSVTLSDHITEIPESAFGSCPALESVVIPESVKTIGADAFKNCTALRSVTIPSSVTSIGSEAFNSCSALTTVTIPGAATLWSGAFANCTGLTSVRLSSNSKTAASAEAFSNCPKLYKVNGVTALQHQTDKNGIQYPVFHSNAMQAVRNHFCRSNKIAFIDDFCTELCSYIVATETDEWMNDAQKARQLHDWLLRHCEYEDERNGEKISDRDNHVASSVFVSYQLNIRGYGIGESSCEGYAQAYTMLLSTAGIESYVVSGYSSYFLGHGWNLIKIDGKFYEADATWDDDNWDPNQEKIPYGTNYTYFLKSDAEMLAMHNRAYPNNPFDKTQKFWCSGRHDLIDCYTGNVEALITGCTESYQDDNHDGILDLDFDLDGKWLPNDMNDDQNAFNGMLYFLYGNELNMFQINDKLSEVFYWLHFYHKDFWTFVNTSAPVSQRAVSGGEAKFKVTLFGNLKYRWYCCAAGSNQWVPADAYYGSSDMVLTVPANSSTNGMQFQCVVWNKNDYYIYSNPVTLTVR